MKHALLVTLLLAGPACAQARFVEDFESPVAAAGWNASGGDVGHSPNAHDGAQALAWTVAEESGRLWTRRLRGDLRPFGALHGWIFVEGDIETEIVARIRTAGGTFWRRFTVRGGVWSEIRLPFYQFRNAGLADWAAASELSFQSRRAPAKIVLDSWTLEDAVQGQVEPDRRLAERVFPGDSTMASNERFRVVTDAEVRPSEIVAYLDEGLEVFRKSLGCDTPLGAPVTLVVASTPESYRRIAVATARDVYGGIMDEPKAGGFTFYDYSFTSFDPAQGARRPVFVHEACHQLVSRLLGFRGDGGALWIEEGLCYFVQNELAEQADLREQALQLLRNPQRPPLGTLDHRTVMGGVTNLQALFVTRWMVQGPRAANWPAMKDALLRSNAGLAAAAREIYGLESEALDAEWAAWLKAWAESR